MSLFVKKWLSKLLTKEAVHKWYFKNKSIKSCFKFPGIPEQADLAETYYEQFNEFDDDDADIVVGGAEADSDSEEEGDEDGTLVQVREGIHIFFFFFFFSNQR